MVVQVFFGERDVFQRYGAPAAFEFNEFIDPNPSHNILIVKLYFYFQSTVNKVSGRLPEANLPTLIRENKLLTGVQLVLDVVYDGIDGEQVTHFIDIRVFLERFQIGMRHFFS